MDVKELKYEVADRRSKVKDIGAKVNAYCRETYGIPSMTTFIDMVFGEQTKFAVCLARQIPTVNVEHIAKHLFADWLGRQGLECEPIAMAFPADSLTYNNPTKVSYVKRPVLFRGNSGKLVVQNQPIAKDTKTAVDRAILGNVVANNGMNLVRYHEHARRKLFGTAGPRVDVTQMLIGTLQCTLAAKNRSAAPSRIFIEDGIREKLIAVDDLNGHRITRPPKDWYYFFHLLSFLDGRRALFSRIGDDPKMAATFKQAVEKVADIAGVPPLVIDTPDAVVVEGTRFHLDEVPRWVELDPDWRRRIADPDDQDLFRVKKHFEIELYR